jgi:hypothetical protein
MLQRLILKRLLKLVAWLAGKLFLPALIWFVATLSLDRWQFRKCESCAEKIRRRAVVCRYCGHRMPTDPNCARVADSHRFPSNGLFRNRVSEESRVGGAEISKTPLRDAVDRPTRWG